MRFFKRWEGLNILIAVIAIFFIIVSIALIIEKKMGYGKGIPTFYEC